MRVCWNWQTGTFEGRVSYGVRVQVPSLAPTVSPYRTHCFFMQIADSENFDPCCTETYNFWPFAAYM